MANFKQISVFVSGNPTGNAGVGSIVTFNNPQFEVGNDTHGGLGGNDYYFSLKIEEDYTVYKLIKNNVRSFQAVRAGYLAIAFSIPRGYELVETNPYRVLTDLWETFRKSCMRPKDFVNQIYEFNSEKNMDKDALNEMAGRIALRATKKAYRPMNSQSSQVGLVVRPKEKIEELLKDVQYLEFSSFKEILIAEQANNTTNYSVLSGIQIPRPVSYKVMVDGMQRDFIADINKVIEVSSALNSVFYQNDTKKFSVSELQDGRQISGVELDEEHEQVIVSTDGWATPKEQKYHIRIEPSEGETYFIQNKGLLKVYKGLDPVTLDKNLDFVLKGEEIGYVAKSQIGVDIADNKKYRLTSQQPVVNGNDICVTVEKITEQKPISTPAKKDIPFVTVKLSLSKTLFEKKKSKSDCLKVRCRVNNEIRQTTQVHFTNSNLKNKSCLEGCIFIPKEWGSVYVGYKVGKVWYESVSPVKFRKDENNFAEKDFKQVEQPSALFSKWTVMIACALLLFAGGFGVGWILSGQNEEESNGNKKDLKDTPDEEEQDNQEQKLQKECIEFLQNVKSTLKKKDVTFEEIRDYAETYEDSSYKDVDVPVDSLSKVGKQLLAYEELVTAIENENVEVAIELAGDNLISKDHADKVRQLNGSNIAGVTSFVEIEESSDSGSVASPATGTGTSHTSQAMRPTGTGALKSYPKSDKKILWRCKDNVAAGGDAECTFEFSDESGLRAHIRKGKHKHDR